MFQFFLRAAVPRETGCTGHDDFTRLDYFLLAINEFHILWAQ